MRLCGHPPQAETGSTGSHGDPGRRTRQGADNCGVADETIEPEETQSREASLDWQGWPHSDSTSEQMLLFEAFVSNKDANRATRHIDDAVLAAQSLHARLSRNETID